MVDLLQNMAPVLRVAIHILALFHVTVQCPPNMGSTDTDMQLSLAKVILAETVED